MRIISRIPMVWIIPLVSWALPIYGVIYNQIYPSYESALGVAYAFFIGCMIHFLLIVLWLIFKGLNIDKLELIMLVISSIILIVLTIASNNGSLSKLNA